MSNRLKNMPDLLNEPLVNKSYRITKHADLKVYQLIHTSNHAKMRSTSNRSEIMHKYVHPFIRVPGCSRVSASKYVGSHM